MQNRWPVAARVFNASMERDPICDTGVGISAERREHIFRSPLYDQAGWRGAPPRSQHGTLAIVGGGVVRIVLIDNALEAVLRRKTEESPWVARRGAVALLVRRAKGTRLEAERWQTIIGATKKQKTGDDHEARDESRHRSRRQCLRVRVGWCFGPGRGRRVSQDRDHPTRLSIEVGPCRAITHPTSPAQGTRS